jgi:hypothetical protein
MSSSSAPFVVVPCSAAKAAGDELPAGERYLGQLHKLALAAALELTTPDRVRILSARYGLLTLDAPTAPYDAKVGELNADDERALRFRIHAGAVAMVATDPEAAVVALVPAAYAEALASSPLLEARLVRPLAGCGGIGRMRGLLCQLRDGALDVELVAA